MCQPSQCACKTAPFMDRLSKLSTAEDFFTTLKLDFDQKVLNVSRLHILKRFHDLLDQVAVGAMDDAAAESACRQALAHAYSEYADGGGRKTFKVFQDSQASSGFVPLSAIRPAR